MSSLPSSPPLCVCAPWCHCVLDLPRCGQWDICEYLMMKLHPLPQSRQLSNSALPHSTPLDKLKHITWAGLLRPKVFLIHPKWILSRSTFIIPTVQTFYIINSCCLASPEKNTAEATFSWIVQSKLYFVCISWTQSELDQRVVIFLQMCCLLCLWPSGWPNLLSVPPCRFLSGW